MPVANPMYTLIYIYLLRNSSINIDTAMIAKTFSILESDVINALKYWESVKLFALKEDSFEISISLNSAKPAKKETDKPVISHEIQYAQPPKYTPSELEMYKGSYPEINTLFDKGEKILGKLLSANDLSILYSFYDWLRLPFDVILYLLSYCANGGHRRMKYIEAVAIDWAENGINTVSLAEDYVNLFNRDYRQILSALGITGRNPAPKEVEFMDKWLKEYNMPMDVILEAADISIIATGKPQFTYTDSIIERWFINGVRNLDDVKKAEQSFKEEKIKSGETLKPKSKPKSKFMDYEKDNRSYDEFEKLESEFLLKKLKGTTNEQK
jgi:DnaD/phage-associated family protein